MDFLVCSWLTIRNHHQCKQDFITGHYEVQSCVRGSKRTAKAPLYAATACEFQTLTRCQSAKHIDNAKKG